jgi:hypothetical protein
MLGAKSLAMYESLVLCNHLRSGEDDDRTDFQQ